MSHYLEVNPGTDFWDASDYSALVDALRSIADDLEDKKLDILRADWAIVQTGNPHTADQIDTGIRSIGLVVQDKETDKKSQAAQKEIEDAYHHDRRN